MHTVILYHPTMHYPRLHKPTIYNSTIHSATIYDPVACPYIHFQYGEIIQSGSYILAPGWIIIYAIWSSTWLFVFYTSCQAVREGGVFTFEDTVSPDTTPRYALAKGAERHCSTLGPKNVDTFSATVTFSQLMGAILWIARGSHPEVMQHVVCHSLDISFFSSASFQVPQHRQRQEANVQGLPWQHPSTGWCSPDIRFSLWLVHELWCTRNLI